MEAILPLIISKLYLTSVNISVKNTELGVLEGCVKNLAAALGWGSASGRPRTASIGAMTITRASLTGGTAQLTYHVMMSFYKQAYFCPLNPLKQKVGIRTFIKILNEEGSNGIR